MGARLESTTPASIGANREPDPETRSIDIVWPPQIADKAKRWTAEGLV